MDLKLNVSIIKIISSVVSGTEDLVNSYNFFYPNQKYKLSDIITEILHVLQTGISWNQLRSNINSRSLQWHFHKFVRYDILKKSFDVLLKQYLLKNNNCKYYSIDSTFIKNINGKQRIGRNKQYKWKNGYKLSAFVDQNGIPLSIFCGSGSAYDGYFLKKHIKKLKYYKINIINKFVLADSGYCSDKNRKLIMDHQGKPIIDYNKRKTKDPTKLKKLTSEEKIIYKKRIKVEHTFCWLKKNRRIDTVNEKSIKAFENFVYLAVVKLLVRRMY